jgi:fructose-1,6-bisphosphatase/inositol monophosphatase family enzyme
MIKLHEFHDIPMQTQMALTVAVRAASKAGEIIRENYPQVQAISEKTHGDLVSQIDVKCDTAVHEAIHAAYPDDLIISEELSPEVLPEEEYWIVDPLDGTSAYLFRVSEDMPSVMIAYCDTQGARFSVVYFPLTDEMFYAVRGQGAYVRQRRLRCKDCDLAAAWVDMNQYSNVQYESLEFRKLRERLRQPGGAQLVSSSPAHSGLALRIAEGNKRLSAVVHDNGPDYLKQGPWDVLPIALIFTEAGGSIVSLKGQSYDPFKPEPFLLAASRKLADQIIARL